jgi:hypothetical protein
LLSFSNGWVYRLLCRCRRCRRFERIVVVAVIQEGIVSVMVESVE